MKKLVLKKEVQHELLQSAVSMMVRADRPSSFAVAIDGEEKPNGTVLAHVVIMSGMQAIQLEDYLRKVGLIAFEVIRTEFTE